jgi:hypothetical protein
MTAAAVSQSLPIDSIVVGERHRRDMGDIDGLAASLAATHAPKPHEIVPEALRDRFGWDDLHDAVAAQIIDI